MMRTETETLRRLGLKNLGESLGDAGRLAYIAMMRRDSYGTEGPAEALTMALCDMIGPVKSWVQPEWGGVLLASGLRLAGDDPPATRGRQAERQRSSGRRDAAREREKGATP